LWNLQDYINKIGNEKIFNHSTISHGWNPWKAVITGKINDDCYAFISTGADSSYTDNTPLMIIKI
jgi:hypothetical protein